MTVSTLTMNRFFLVMLSILSFSIVENSYAQTTEELTSKIQEEISEAVPKLSDISINSVEEYFTKIANEFYLGASLYDLIGFAIGMVIYGIFIFHFYRFLAKRDMFNVKLAKKLSTGSGTTKVGSIFAYIITNFFIYPIVIFVWFIVYSLFMFFLAQGVEPTTVFLVVSALVISVRIAAYYAEDLAKDLAKLLPFAMLGVFLLSPQFFTIDDIIQRIDQFSGLFIQITEFLIFAIVIETVLSLSYLVKQKIRPRKETDLDEKIHSVIEEKVNDKVEKIEERHDDLREELEEKREKLREDLQKEHNNLKDKVNNNNSKK